MLSAERGSQALALAIVDRQRGLTPAKALQSPQLSALVRVAPGDAAEALGNLITFTASQFNVVRNLTEVQVALLANDLLERYWFWKLDEFTYLCREAIAGRWGKAYDRIDPPTVHEWCLAYAAVRDQLLAEVTEQEAKAHKLAEQAKQPRRADNEHAFRAVLDTKTDEELQRGIRYYEANPHLPHAKLKAELAAEVLLDRKRLQLLKSVVEQPTDSGGFVRHEEASEEEYLQYRAAWVAERARQAAEDEQQPEAPAA